MAAKTGYDLSSSPSHLLHRAQQYAADRFAAAFDGEPITQRQFAVLVGVAANEGLTQTDLVNSTGIDRSTLAELVARMTSKGYLKRSRAKNDARANVVSLTPKGRTLYTKALPVVKKADDAILEIIAKTKQPAFLATLKGIASELDKRAEVSAPKAAPAKKPASKAKAKPAARKAKPAASKAKARTAAKPKAKARPKAKAAATAVSRAKRTAAKRRKR